MTIPELIDYAKAHNIKVVETKDREDSYKEGLHLIDGNADELFDSIEHAIMENFKTIWMHSTVTAVVYHVDFKAKKLIKRVA